jgi:hypothetical protein
MSYIGFWIYVEGMSRDEIVGRRYYIYFFVKLVGGGVFLPVTADQQKNNSSYDQEITEDVIGGKMESTGSRIGNS